MGLKSKLGASVAGTPDLSGFNFAKPDTLHFQNATDFEKALKLQAEATAVIDSDSLRSIDIDGNVLGTDLRLSQAAFGDLCHWAGVPGSFIKKLAKIDEAQAIDVIETMLRSVFHRGEEKQLVIDSRSSRIDGIVGKETYSHLPNADALAFALTARPGLLLTNGWLSGPDMRVTVVTEKEAQAKKGDIVRFGINMENAIHGDHALKVSDYMERLVCTNGAVAVDEAHIARIIHRGDIEFNTQKAVVASAQRAELLLPLARAATTQLMMPPDIRAMRVFVREPKHGGNPSLEVKVVKEAQHEAAKENRPPEETTLWNWVNAITASAHDAGSVQRRTQLEAMGYRALVRFGAYAN